VTLEELLGYTASHDILLSTSDGELHFDGPRAAVTGELVAALRAHKETLLRRLAGQAPPDEVDRAPVSFQQQRMIQAQSWSAGGAWNVGMRLELTGPVDRTVLAAAVDAVVARHHGLRVRFVQAGTEAEEDGWVQRIVAHRPVPLPLDDLSPLPAAERDRRAEAICRELATEPFRLDEQAPVRWHLLRLDPTTWWLVIVLHHIVCDGWTLTVVLRDLAQAYRTGLGGGRPDLGQAPAQCTDYARWQRSRLDAPTVAQRLAYWMGELGDAALTLDKPYGRRPSAPPAGGDPDSHNPGGHNPDDHDDHQPAHVEVAVPAAIYDAAATLARLSGATVSAVVYAALGVMVTRATGRGDVTVSVPHANRDYAYEDVVAVVATPLLLRIRTTAATTFADLVRQTAATMFAGIDQLLPVAWVYERLARDRSGVPSVVSISAAYQNTLDLTVDLPGLATSVVDLPAGGYTQSLRFSVVPLDGGLTCNLEFPPGWGTPELGQEWLTEYAGVLAAGCRDPQRPLTDLICASTA
jgi:hypothetical protein